MITISPSFVLLGDAKCFNIYQFHPLLGKRTFLNKFIISIHQFRLSIKKYSSEFFGEIDLIFQKNFDQFDN